jgi:uncharacterized protein (TIGR03083 family)
MAKTDVWPAVQTERKALAADLQPFSDEQWATRTLCSNWTVRDVLAHMTATAQLSPASFFPKLIGSGFSLSKLQAKDIARVQGASCADTLPGFQAIIGSTSGPPGPPATMLGETLVHAEDIRRPLGIRHEYATEALVQVADFYKGSNLIIGAKRRIAGVGLRATDTPWSHGTGPEASGPMLAIVLAMTGRTAGIAELTGDGVATLRSRS